MTKIEIVKDVPLPSDWRKPFAEHTKNMSTLLFAYGDKLYGGIARETLFDAPEVWVWLTKAFRPRDLFRLRAYIPELLSRYPYIRARVALEDKVAARFAFTFGFIYEETQGDFHFFSMRAK